MKTEEHRSASISEIENTIRRLRSVVSARVSGNERGEIEEIHVVADDSRHPKQVGRDIESLLLSELGLRVDHRKISIAQLRDSMLTPTEARLKFLTIDLSVDRAELEVKVSLGVGEDIFSGMARSSRQETQLHTIAEATCSAVTTFMQCAVDPAFTGIEVRSVMRSTAPNVGEIVTVAIRLPGPRGEEALIGSSLVKESVWQAAAYATLDAVNRRIARMAS